MNTEATPTSGQSSAALLQMPEVQRFDLDTFFTALISLRRSLLSPEVDGPKQLAIIEEMMCLYGVAAAKFAVSKDIIASIQFSYANDQHLFEHLAAMNDFSLTDSELCRIGPTFLVDSTTVDNTRWAKLMRAVNYAVDLSKDRIALQSDAEGTPALELGRVAARKLARRAIEKVAVFCQGTIAAARQLRSELKVLILLLRPHTVVIVENMPPGEPGGTLAFLPGIVRSESMFGGNLEYIITSSPIPSDSTLDRGEGG
jgi:hypothetical protein